MKIDGRASAWLAPAFPSELPGGAEIIDLGQHSLKDLERSQPLFHLVAPGLRSGR